jgi:hypothetical protein
MLVADYRKKPLPGLPGRGWFAFRLAGQVMTSINHRWLETIVVAVIGCLSLSAYSEAQPVLQTGVSATAQGDFSGEDFAMEDFERGKAAFNESDYASAVKFFTRVESQGRTSPALYYNLASSYFMLRQYDQAVEYFNKVRQYSEMQDLAEYNLGLVALIENNLESARKLFTSVVMQSEDKKLVTLANKKLEYTMSQQQREHLTDRWSADVSFSLGYDDNVNFVPLDVTGGDSDSFTELYTRADYLLSGDRKDGWLGQVSFYNINYRTEDIYDEYEYAVAIKKYLQLNIDWQTIYALDITRINFNSEPYQTIARFEAESRYRFADRQLFLLGYSYEDIKSDDSLYDYLEGWRQKFRAEYSIYYRRDNSRFYYELELNDRNDLNLSTGDFSYSPVRHLFLGKHTFVLSRQWDVTGELSWRNSDYPQTASQDREDNRLRATIYSDYRFTRDLRLRAEAMYTDNSSTEDFYDYKQTIMTLGLIAYF